MAMSDNMLVQEGLGALRGRLPVGWRLDAQLSAPSGDATATIIGPDQRSAQLFIEARARIEPKDVRSLVDALSARRHLFTPVVVARYLGENTRGRLRDGDVGYLDLTGNVRICLAVPGLYIETQGASEDPDREERPARSLRGAKAGRIAQSLINLKAPLGVRELAELTKIDAGYVSRVLSFLDSEALIVRVGRGRIESVDWAALLRRVAQDAPLESRGLVRTFLEPRGLPALLTRLARFEGPYAVTGSLAASTLAPISPARLATVWVRDGMSAAGALGLRFVDSGANVMLVEAADAGVFEDARRRDGVWYATPSQVAIDLLTSPGRGPQEGEALIEWMRANEEKWRS